VLFAFKTILVAAQIEVLHE